MLVTVGLSACTSGDEPAGTRDCQPADASATTRVSPIDTELVPAFELDGVTGFDVSEDVLWMTRRSGQLVRVVDGTAETVLDISGSVDAAGEGGLLDVEIAHRSKLHLSYTNGQSLVVEQRTATEASVGPPTTVYTHPSPTAAHHGGSLATAPDGTLLIGVGDGGFEQRYAQEARDLQTPYGSILRIEPDDASEDGYAVPADNPFANTGDALSEIWAYGVRNPWGLHVHGTEIWISDVGAGCWEEINVLDFEADGGSDLGWPDMEGLAEMEPNPPAVRPVHTYVHTGPATAIVGGFVYEGERFPSLRGAFIFGDFGNGTVSFLRQTDNGWETGLLTDQVVQPIAIGESVDGEILVGTLANGVIRVEPSSNE